MRKSLDAPDFRKTVDDPLPTISRFDFMGGSSLASSIEFPVMIMISLESAS
jgi:hypothetical protein